MILVAWNALEGSRPQSPLTRIGITFLSRRHRIIQQPRSQAI